MVNRCICSNVLFSEVKKIALQENYQTVEDLKINDICCKNCELCRPYIEEMLKTGETSFTPQDILNRKYAGSGNV